MIDKFCEFITKKIRKEMPEIDDERAEVILYGVQLIVGELPKIFLMFAFGIILGLWWQTLLAFFLILPYKVCSGGFHLKTHLGCIIGTTLIYCGVAKVSCYIVFYSQILKYITILSVWIFGMIMVYLYAPADTENVPILSKKERKYKKIMSYIFLSIGLIASCIVPNNEISNILLLSYFVQSVSITKIAYKLTKNKYGYEVYSEQNILHT